MSNFQLISNELIEQLIPKAKEASRQRINYNFHELTDKVQRFLNIAEPNSYITPHKHQNPPKNETFIIIRGRINFFIFDNEGNITSSILIDANDKNIGIDIKAGTWHTFIALDSTAVVFEIKDGPYNPDTDKIFAPFAPQENSKEAKDYLDLLHKHCMDSI